MADETILCDIDGFNDRSNLTVDDMPGACKKELYALRQAIGDYNTAIMFVSKDNLATIKHAKDCKNAILECIKAFKEAKRVNGETELTDGETAMIGIVNGLDQTFLFKLNNSGEEEHDHGCH